MYIFAMTCSRTKTIATSQYELHNQSYITNYITKSNHRKNQKLTNYNILFVEYSNADGGASFVYMKFH